MSKIDESTHAIWHDPSVYDADRHGPPYLRNRTATAKVRELLRREARGQVGAVDRVVAALEGSTMGGAKHMTALLIMLRALSMVHQTHHWQTGGATSYSDHLLFERLYDETSDEIDAVAERAVGLGGRDAVDPILIAAKTSECVALLSSAAGEADSLAEASYRAESKFLLGVQILVKRAQGAFSRGTDNLIAGIEDKHESHIYLLHQRLGG